MYSPWGEIIDWNDDFRIVVPLRDGAARGAMHQRQTRKERHTLDHIRLLCDCGTGLEAIASPLCNSVRDLVNAESGSLFWLDASGNAAGFYHDCAPAEIKDIFITRFAELFADPDQPNMVSLTEVVEPSIGRTLIDGYMESFWAGNIYRYLCVPLGHHYFIDMRIDVAGAGRAVFCLWNGPDHPFTQADAARLAKAQPFIQAAAANDGDAVAWYPVTWGTAHLVTDIDASTIHTINAEAEALLMKSHLLQQRIAMTQPPRIVPGFVKQLSDQLAGASHAVMHVPVATGRIVARASRTTSLGGSDGEKEMMFVSLELEAAINVKLVAEVMALPLSTLQRQIALYAMQGGSRADCEAEFGVRDEALKKHLRAIFAATNTTKWIELAAIAGKVREGIRH